MHSKRSLEGYILIDQSNAPASSMLPGGQKFESATITCCHCNRIVILNPDRSRPRNHCRSCDAYVCDDVACGECNGSFSKVLDEMEKTLRRGAGHALIP